MATVMPDNISLTLDGNTSPTIANGITRKPKVLVNMYITMQITGTTPLSAMTVPFSARNRYSDKPPMKIIIPMPEIIDGIRRPNFRDTPAVKRLAIKRAMPINTAPRKGSTLTPDLAIIPTALYMTTKIPENCWKKKKLSIMLNGTRELFFIRCFRTFFFCRRGFSSNKTSAGAG